MSTARLLAGSLPYSQPVVCRRSGSQGSLRGADPTGGLRGRRGARRRHRAPASGAAGRPATARAVPRPGLRPPRSVPRLPRAGEGLDSPGELVDQKLDLGYPFNRSQRCTWGDGSPSRRCALSEIRGRVPGMVPERRGLPGLPGVAAVAGGLRMLGLWPPGSVAPRRRPTDVLRVREPFLGDRGHDLRPYANAVDGLVQRLLAVRQRQRTGFRH